ncbi:50S ribosomal protein L3 [bacterium]|nr:50S ribosomal protein L3 [bacterium]
MSTAKNYKEGLLGRKIGMTQVFTEDGKSVPVSVIEAGPNVVLQVKTVEKDGYSAVQVGFGEKKVQRANKAEAGHFAKAQKGAFSHQREFRCDVESLEWNEVGKELSVGEVFEKGDFLDISGTSKGKGFQGVVRRFGTRGQPATRGTHEMRRHIGSIGCRKFPGRVWKNQKMPGQMGGRTVTKMNLRVVDVLPEKNVILVKGAVPGAINGIVTLRKAQKKGASKAA